MSVPGRPRARMRTPGFLRGLLAAVSSGALLAAASPPMDWNGLGFVALIPLLAAIEGAHPLRAFVLALISGMVFCAIGAFWIQPVVEGFGQLAGVEAWLWPLAVMALHALLVGLWGGLAALSAQVLRVPWMLSAALAMVLAQALWPMLFPWTFAISIWPFWPLTQIAELGGSAAVAGLLVLINVWILELWRCWRSSAGLATEQTRRVRFFSQGLSRSALVGGATIALVIAAGLLRAWSVSASLQAAPKVKIAIVQSQQTSMSAEDRAAHGIRQVEALRAASDQAFRAGADLVIWPESAFPFLYARDLQVEYPQSHPWALRSERSGYLMIGALSHDFDGGSTMYNSALLFDPAGKLAGIADKRRLIPFGEYIPWAARFPEWARALTERLEGHVEITAGTGSALLESGPFRVLALICYEDLFDDYVAGALRGQDANLMVTLANHARFRQGGAAQAMAAASLRSIEHRRYLLRATSTGVTSFTDPLGRTTIPMVAEINDGQGQLLPQVLYYEAALNTTPAWGTYSVPYFPWACALLLLLAAARARLRERPA